MYKYILVCIIIFGIIGCRTTYKLSKDDLRFNPYKGGEALIFKSSQGDIDTIFIREVTITSVPNDPLAILPKYHDVLNVNVKHSDPTSINGHRYLESCFFELTATNDHNTIFGFNLAAKKALFYADSFFKEDLEKLSIVELITKAFTYKDVIKLAPQSLKYYERDEFIVAVYWSKKTGYVRFDLKNGLYWELTNSP